MILVHKTSPCILHVTDHISSPGLTHSLALTLADLCIEFSMYRPHNTVSFFISMELLLHYYILRLLTRPMQNVSPVSPAACRSWTLLSSVSYRNRTIEQLCFLTSREEDRGIWRVHILSCHCQDWFSTRESDRKLLGKRFFPMFFADCENVFSHFFNDQLLMPGI